MESVKIIGRCKDPKTIAWLLEKHGDFLIKSRNTIQQKIEEYLISRNIPFVFKNPVYFERSNKSYFVDYYLPAYKVLIDVRPLMSSEYFNAVEEKRRRRDLKLVGCVYLPVDYSDIREERLIRKINGVLKKSVDKICKNNIKL